MIRYATLIGLLLAVCGCETLPEEAHLPVIRNPFPQLRRVAVAPFFNQSDEPTVDGRRFALAYYNELQATPGFEAVPVNVVIEAIRHHRIRLDQPSEARRLAQVLGVDAVLIGSVTEYSPYYPPRLGLQMEWWAANPAFAPIPPGYGLPWGTSEEEYIPEPLIYEAELAKARAQLKAQTPPIESETSPAAPATNEPELLPVPPEVPDGASPDNPQQAAHVQPIVASRTGVTTGPLETIGENSPPKNMPVIRETRIYHGNDRDFTTALSTYAFFRNDARYGGWEAYLQRSDDFIRFCCRMHISETLSARGGAAKTRVAWLWLHDR